MYNVLLVDDEPRTIDALEKNVNWRDCGIRKIYRAMSMQEAITVYQEKKPEIIICDIEMPSGSGLQLLKWMRDEGKKINCIFVTCHPEFDYMRKAIQLNCYDYILKPINYEEFSKVLSELVYKMESVEGGMNVTKSTYVEGISDVPSLSLVGENRSRERNVELEVKKYIREHLVDNITVTDIAQELHFNPQYLMRTFKSKTEMSIVEYITKTRIDTAKTILAETDLPIKEVTNMVGYSDYAYFGRVFHKEVGESPSHYRNRKR